MALKGASAADEIAEHAEAVARLGWVKANRAVGSRTADRAARMMEGVMCIASSLYGIMP